jgi:hypothetical protein
MNQQMSLFRRVEETRRVTEERTAPAPAAQVPGTLCRIPFRGTDLIGIAGVDPSSVRVAVKPICDHMGIDWAGQFTKLKDHAVLATCIEIIPMQMPTTTK